MRAKEKTNPKPVDFGFERRRKGANAVFGKSLWLMPETKLSGLCADDVVPVTGFEPVHPLRIWDFKSQVSASSTTPARWAL